MYPFYLLKMRVTNNFETTRDYNTGQTSSILPVCARTTLYNNYFLTSTVRSWNNEPMATKNSRCPSSLKSYYKSKCIKKLQLDKSFTWDYKLHVALMILEFSKNGWIFKHLFWENTQVMNVELILIFTIKMKSKNFQNSIFFFILVKILSY